MKYAILLLLGVSAWGQTATMPCVPGSDPNQGACTGYVPTPEQMGKCPEGRVALGIPNDDGSPSGFAECVLAKLPQSSQNAPLASWKGQITLIYPEDVKYLDIDAMEKRIAKLEAEWAQFKRAFPSLAPKHRAKKKVGLTFYGNCFAPDDTCINRNADAVAKKKAVSK